MKIEKEDLKNYPELMAFIEADNNGAQEEAFKQLKPTYQVSCFDSDAYEDQFSGTFGLSPLIIISSLGLSKHLDVILRHQSSSVFYSHSYFPAFKKGLMNQLSSLFNQVNPDKMTGCCYSLTEGAHNTIIDGFFALRAAAAIGDAQIIQALLEIPQYRKTLTHLNNIILRTAITAGHLEAVSILLAEEDVITRIQKGGCRILLTAIRAQSLDILNKLLTFRVASSRESIESLSESCWKSDYDSSGDSSLEEFYLVEAIKSSTEECAGSLFQLLQLKESLAENDNRILRLALCNKKFNLANQLLDLPSVQSNLASREGRVLHVAAAAGNIDIINRLLTFPEVLEHVDSQNNFAITLAAGHGHIEVVKRLLNIPNVANQLEKCHYRVVRAAYFWEDKPHNEIIELLRPCHGALPNLDKSFEQQIMKQLNDGYAFDGMADIKKADGIFMSYEQDGLPLWSFENFEFMSFHPF